jgi:hypothetical protein
MQGTALSLPICIVWGPGLTGYGGLAPAAVIVLTSLFIGASTSPRITNDKTEPNALREALRQSLAEIVATGVIGAAFAPLLHDFGNLTAMAIAVGLWIMAVSVNRVGPHALWLLLLMFTALFVISLTYIAVNGPAWTLLDPQWGTWRHWMGASIMGGVVLGGAGAGVRAQLPKLEDHDEGSHWIGLGCSVLAFACGLVLIAHEWEISAPEPTFYMLPILGWLGVLSAASAFQMGPGGRWLPWTGALFCAWFAGPGFPAVFFWWVSILPSLIVLYLCLGGLDSWRPALLAALCGILAIACWPGLPNSPGDAGILGLTVVFIFWMVASRGALSRRL